jgi:hypothetical protein
MMVEDGGKTSAVYSRALNRLLPVRDVRAEFAQGSGKSRQEERAEVQAFLASKKRLIQAHPQMTAQEKQAAIAAIDASLGEGEDRPATPCP